MEIRLRHAFLLAALLLLASSAYAGMWRLRGGVRHFTAPPAASAPSVDGTVSTPPLEGPLTHLAATFTDERTIDDFDFFASAHIGVSGAAFPGATMTATTMLLDSGAGTHIVSYPDAVGLGVQGDALSGNTLAVGGAGGTLDVDISYPLGFFVHGLQDLDVSGDPQPSLMFGQGNFSCGVNTEFNFLNGNDVPTILGAPFLLYFPASIRNSAPVPLGGADPWATSPSVNFFAGPTDPSIPVYPYRIFLQIRPGSSGAVVSFLGFPDLDLNIVPLLPSLLSGDSSLYFTASSMEFTEGTDTSSGLMMVDTGAQATLLSEIAAAELGLNILEPDFEVEVEGLAGVVTAPGFYIDQVSVPAGGGEDVVWTQVPTVILNLGSPEGGTLYGIFGMNLLADRDLVFNGAATPPYLDVTAPFIPPAMDITGVEPTAEGGFEFAWHTQPAPPVLHLRCTDDLTSEPVQWTTVATGDLATINGVLSAPSLSLEAFYQLFAP